MLAKNIKTKASIWRTESNKSNNSKIKDQYKRNKENNNNNNERHS